MTSFADISGTSPPWIHMATGTELNGILTSTLNKDILIIQLNGSRMKILDDSSRNSLMPFHFLSILD